MKWILRLLVVVLVAAAGVASVELFHPRGLTGAIRDWTGGAPEPTSPPARPAHEEPAKPEAPAPRKRGAGAASILLTADTYYDRGDFEDASLSYSAAKGLAADAAEEDRANRGAAKSLLAWALVCDAPRVTAVPKDAEVEFERRLREVETAPTEEGWLALTRYAEGAGLRQRLPYLAGRTLDSAKTDGAVRAQLDAAIARAGRRAGDLAAAIESRGFRRPAVPVRVPEDATAHEAPDPTGSTTRPGVPGAGSGIGGVGERGVPLGSFSAAMRERLREAVRLQKQGAEEYRLAGPDGTDRPEHRRRALETLRKVRDVYVDASGEDSRSLDLEERMREVTLMLAQLKKDAAIGEK